MYFKIYCSSHLQDLSHLDVSAGLEIWTHAIVSAPLLNFTYLVSIALTSVLCNHYCYMKHRQQISGPNLRIDSVMHCDNKTGVRRMLGEYRPPR